MFSPRSCLRERTSPSHPQKRFPRSRDVFQRMACSEDGVQRSAGLESRLGPSRDRYHRSPVGNRGPRHAPSRARGTRAAQKVARVGAVRSSGYEWSIGRARAKILRVLLSGTISTATVPGSGVQ